MLWALLGIADGHCSSLGHGLIAEDVGARCGNDINGDVVLVRRGMGTRRGLDAVKYLRQSL